MIQGRHFPNSPGDLSVVKAVLLGQYEDRNSNDESSSNDEIRMTKRSEGSGAVLVPRFLFRSATYLL